MFSCSNNISILPSKAPLQPTHKKRTSLPHAWGPGKTSLCLLLIKHLKQKVFIARFLYSTSKRTPSTQRKNQDAVTHMGKTFTKRSDRSGCAYCNTVGVYYLVLYKLFSRDKDVLCTVCPTSKVSYGPFWAFWTSSRPLHGPSRPQIFHGPKYFCTAPFEQKGRGHGHLATLVLSRDWTSDLRISYQNVN